MNKDIDKKVLGQSTGVIKKFQTNLEIRFVEDYQINLVTEKFRAYDLILSFGLDQVHKMVDYYFRVNKNPSWTHFLKSSTRLRRAMLDQAKDEEDRKDLAKKARDWLNK